MLAIRLILIFDPVRGRKCMRFARAADRPTASLLASRFRDSCFHLFAAVESRVMPAAAASNAAALADWYVPDCSPSVTPEYSDGDSPCACILASLVSLETLTGTFFATASAADAPDRSVPQTLCLATAEPARKEARSGEAIGAQIIAQAVLIAAR